MRHRELPTWPIVLMIVGFPLWWVTGLMPFVPIIASAVLMALLMAKRRIEVLPGVLPFLVFVCWVLICVVSLDTPMKYVGFLMRWSVLLAAGLTLLYITNCRERLSDDLIVRSLAVLWGLVIVGGYLGMLLPEFRFTTPVAHVLPGGVTSNPLVKDLVSPRFSEVQTPWGAPGAFNRPSAPFPYTNSWGLATALLTPFAFFAFARAKHIPTRVVIVIGLCASAWPAAATSNRGMLLILLITLATYAIHQVCRGRWKRVAWLAAGLLVAAQGYLLLGGLEQVEARSAYSDSAGGRRTIYVATFRAALDSPVVGYGAPRPSDEIGIALGTQGAAWMYLFSYGFVGLCLFLVFLLNVIARFASATRPGDLWLHSLLVGAVFGIFFYGLDFAQLLVLVLAAGLLIRRPYIPGETATASPALSRPQQLRVIGAAA